eukprot:TRINITY_DN63499_c0_g1_i1.p1 TRINITY_DN63499_c0_g1~~TRINITY_DN63499_c0_g1_i1.p1  ORF type:complete len:453 (+),score=87.91 TRINITY_DN63499_c0_g1_i1:101-1459(+)
MVASAAAMATATPLPLRSLAASFPQCGLIPLRRREGQLQRPAAAEDVSSRGSILPRARGRRRCLVGGARGVARSILLLWASFSCCRLVGAGVRLERVTSDDPLNPRCVPREDDYADLKDVRIHAIIYSGRREYLEILNPYLERDLKQNGGVLDSVHFALVKYTFEDLRYMIELKKRNPKVYFIPQIDGGGWDVVWRLASEKGAYYLKIDDDISYIAEGAIAELIREKRRGRFLFVSANVVNHGIMSAVHQELAALRWMQPPQQLLTPGGAPTNEAWSYRGDVVLDPRFRVEHTFYSDCIWRRWDCAALAHEALLHRLADGSACAFDFGVFDFHSHGYGTMSDGLGRSIDWNDNFFAFKHEDFSDIDWIGVMTDDEAEMSTKHPRRRGEHAAALGRALVSHFAFSVQERGLRLNTTLLKRYLDFARPLMRHLADTYYGGMMQPVPDPYSIVLP